MSKLMGYVVERKVKPIVFLVEKTCDFNKSKTMEQFLKHMKIMYSQSKVYCEYQFMFFTFSGTTLVHSDGFIELPDFCTCKVLKQNQVNVSDFLAVLDANMTFDKFRRWSTYYVPHIILLSDGCSEYVNYEHLDSIFENNEVLKKARRCVVSFGKPSEKTNRFFSQFVRTSKELMIIDEIRLSLKSTVKGIAKSIFDTTKEDNEEIERDFVRVNFFKSPLFEDIVSEDPLEEDD